ncbi:Uncharacterized protein GBIM_18969 [Gryllus bimaculatus]|nr:Uncharacterized protein GBIM_18969 [Gryllus bimaculatus]
MTVSLFSRRCLHSVLLLCVCCSSYGVASAQSDRDVASGRKTDYHDDEEDGPSPTHSAAEGVTAASEGSTLPAVALGAQCLYAQTCSFTDQHAECTQINHNAVCQCKAGYHEVSLQRPSRRVFCSPVTLTRV